MGNPQPFTPPYTANALVIDVPAFTTKQSCDPAIAIATILARQIDDRCCQSIFIAKPLWLSPLGRSMLTDRFARPAL